MVRIFPTFEIEISFALTVFWFEDVVFWFEDVVLLNRN